MRPNAVKAKLKTGAPSIGTWLSLGSVLASRFLARVGLDWLTVDLEHSSAGIETASHIFGAVADAGCTALARVPSNRHDHIKRVLDSGAMGVVVPMVNSRQEAEDAVAACFYPPKGNRSVGGSASALNFDASAAEYFAQANDELLVVLQCEHIRAVERADEIFSVPGIDAIFVGPNDLAASMRSSSGAPPSVKASADTLAHILATCRIHGVAPGLHCANATEAKLRISEGWQMLAVGSELKMMLDGAAAVMRTIRGDAGEELARY